MAEQDREIRECEHCHAVMQPLGKLPAIGGKPLVKVFVCHACNRVESDVRGSSEIRYAANATG
jgi:hypothetical protein